VALPLTPLWELTVLPQALYMDLRGPLCGRERAQKWEGKEQREEEVGDLHPEKHEKSSPTTCRQELIRR